MFSGGGAFKTINDDPLEALGAGGDPGAVQGGGFDFVSRNPTSNFAEWKLKF